MHFNSLRESVIFIRYLFSITTCSTRVFFGSSFFGGSGGGAGLAAGFKRVMGTLGVLDVVVDVEEGRREALREVAWGINIWSADKR